MWYCGNTDAGMVLNNDAHISEYGKWERRYAIPPNQFGGDATRGGTRGAGELV